MTQADIDWLKDYCLSSAFAAEQEFCVGVAEHKAAADDADRAAQLFDSIKQLLAERDATGV